MPEEPKEYLSFPYDTLLPGRQLKLDRSIYCEQYDLSDLIGKTPEQLQAMIDESTAGENKAFQIVQAAADQWEKQAAVTQRLFRAMDYVKTPAAEHTGNQWAEGKDGERFISNKVYKMTCRIHEDTHRNPWRDKPPAPRWTVEWALSLNTPKENWTVRIAGQEKTYDDRAAAERYLNGRIAAYARLFSELSPPVPEKYAENFTVSERLLPGYRIEGRQPDRDKPSVLDQLAQAKTQKAAAPATPKEPKKDEPEI